MIQLNLIKLFEKPFSSWWKK